MNTMKNVLESLIFVSLFSYVILESQITIDMRVPEIVIYPSAVWLNCSVRKADSQDDSSFYQQVETIKWFKDNKHFFTFAPPDGVTAKPLLDNGVTDISREDSREGNVYLSRSNVNTTGTFTCKVRMKDGRSFSNSMSLTTLYLPYGFPSIQIDPRMPLESSSIVGSVKAQNGHCMTDSEIFLKDSKPQIVIIDAGQLIRVNCTSQESFPKGSLSIRVNGEEVPKKSMINVIHQERISWDGIRGIPFHNRLIVTSLLASIRMTPSMSKNGFARVVCSSVMSNEKHGFLNQQDSDTIRVRIVQMREKLYEIPKYGYYKYMFYGILIITVIVLVSDSFWRSFSDKKSFAEDEKVVLDLLQSAQNSRRPSVYIDEFLHKSSNRRGTTVGQDSGGQVMNDEHISQ